MFRYLLVPHSFVATYLSLAQTSIRADSPSGKTQQVERCENMLACFHIRAEDVSVNSPQPSSFCESLGSGVQGCCSSLCCASVRAGSRDKSASPPRPCGKARRQTSAPYRVEGLLDGLSNDSFKVVLEIFLVNFDYIVIHRKLFF